MMRMTLMLICLMIPCVGTFTIMISGTFTAICSSVTLYRTAEASVI